MSDISPDHALMAKLKAVISHPDVKANVKTQGARLLKRLECPVRTLVTGLPGCGKSEVMNLLAGQQVVQGGSQHPDIRLTWSEKVQTELTAPNGGKTFLDGSPLTEAATSDAAIVEVGLPSPLLKHTDLLETRFDIQSGDRRAVSDQITRSAEIIVWCSERFTPREQEFWHQMPDKVKDHSFLVLTKADVLAAEGSLQSTLKTLDDTAGEAFYSLIPVAALQANSARRDDGSIDEAILSGSGATSLINAIIHQAAEGRMADADNALFFVRKYASFSSPAAEAPKAELRTIPDTITVDVDAESPLPPQAEPTPETVDPFPPALVHLQLRTGELMKVSEDPGTETTRTILEHCIETTSQLVDIFDDIEVPTPDVSALQNTLTEATDTIILMQLEKDADAAADAATILLQIKRELAAGMAA